MDNSIDKNIRKTIKVLVGTENESGQRNWDRIPAEAQIILFVSKHSTSLIPMFKSFGNRWPLQCIYVFSSAKNATNAKICEYIWEDSFKVGNDTKYYIITDSHDLNQELDIMKHHGIDVERGYLSDERTFLKPNQKTSYLLTNPAKIPPIDDVPVIIEKDVESKPHSFDERILFPWRYENTDIMFTPKDRGPEKTAESEELISCEQKEDNGVGVLDDKEPESQTPIEVTRRNRQINREKREKCRDYLTSIGFNLNQAKVVTSGMPAVMADMIVSRTYKNKNELEKVRLRTSLKLRRITSSDKTVDKLVNDITKNATVVG